uniref:Uncharacterized protein n=1 Tax=Anguilla anguilla TaxID=7936 RepID=A0A0E9U614_ANGAN
MVLFSPGLSTDRQSMWGQSLCPYHYY